MPLAPQHAIFIVVIDFVSSSNQFANMFNKSLKESDVHDICDKLDSWYTCSSLRGSRKYMIWLH